MTMITPQRRAQLALAGRIGGLTAALTTDTVARAEKAQRGLRESFLNGHRCAVCKPISWTTTDPEERARLADTAYRLHMARLRNPSKEATS